jgi:hypothetical protein
MPINHGEFNKLLESHIDDGLAPTRYVGNQNPINDDLWLMVHEWQLADQDRTFAAISYPELDFDTLMSKAILPVLNARFGLRPDDMPLCFERRKNCVKAYIEHRFNNFPDSTHSPITVTWPILPYASMYPIIHDTPVLIHDGSQTYITAERLLPYNIIGMDNMELASMAVKTTASAQERSKSSRNWASRQFGKLLTGFRSHPAYDPSSSGLIR